MEEFDDGLQKPDEGGLLDMSHRAWRMLDEAIWGWYVALLGQLPVVAASAVHPCSRRMVPD